MTKFSGSFTGKISWQASVTIPVPGNHNLGVLETRGPQTSADPQWNDAAISYYGMADLTDGSGPQKGYFHNVRADGEQDWGSFEGKVTTSGEEVTLEGSWQFIGGTGKFQSISGSGTYKGRMTSPTDMATDWTGEYQL